MRIEILHTSVNYRTIRQILAKMVNCLLEKSESFNILLDALICMFSCMFYFKFCFESLEFSNIWEILWKYLRIRTAYNRVIEWHSNFR